jgi:predicted transposase YbfD/YdcC
MKKRLALLVTISLVFTPLAHGAPKKVALKKISIIADAPAAEMLLASKTSIITIATVDSKTTDIALQSNDVNGAVIWQKVIDSGVDAGALLQYINFELSNDKQNEYKAQALREAGEDAKVNRRR